MQSDGIVTRLLKHYVFQPSYYHLILTHCLLRFYSFYDGLICVGFLYSVTMVSTSGAVYSPSSSRCNRNSPILNLAVFGVMSVYDG